MNLIYKNDICITYIGIIDYFWNSIKHSLPDPGKVPEIKHIMEFGWSWQHFDLGHLPQPPSQWDQLSNCCSHFFQKASLATIMPCANHTWRIQVRHSKKTIHFHIVPIPLWTIHPITLRFVNWQQRRNVLSKINKYKRYLLIKIAYYDT